MSMKKGNLFNVAIDIDKLIAGDEKVFKSLFDAAYNELVRTATFYVNDSFVAEDIVQEVFIQLWEKREELRGVRSLPDFMLHCVKNRCLNHVKHQQVEDRYKQHCLQEELSEEDESANEECLEKLEHLLEHLPEKRREVLKMSVFESKSYEEISKTLNISMNTVKDHIKKAYAFLRDGMNGDTSPMVLFYAIGRWVKKKNIP